MTYMSDSQRKSENSQFIKLLRLIVSHSPDAIYELELAQTMSQLPRECGFVYHRAPDLLSSCDCWYDLQYFDFITDNRVDSDILNAICENIDRGTCRHTRQDCNCRYIDKNQSRCIISLLHAAAACGNLSVFSFLVDTGIQSCSGWPCAGIHLLTLAAKNSQSHILKYILKCVDTGKLSVNMFYGDTELVIRDKATGKLLTDSCPESCYIVRLLDLYDISDTKTVVYLFKVLCHFTYILDLKDTLVNLVLHKAVEMVEHILSSKRIQEIMFSPHSDYQDLVTACVLVDADKILLGLMAKEVAVMFKKHQYNMMDVAVAFGSEKCANIFQSFMNATPNIFTKLSPYNFLILMEETFPPMVDYGSMFAKCLEQGFGVNAKDETFGVSPINSALTRRLEDMVKPLLEMGADVNGKHGEKTSIALALDTTQVERNQWIYIPLKLGVLKDILYYNPDPDLTENALHTAVQYDIKTAYILHAKSDRVITFILDSANERVYVLAETTENRYMAVSAFALLYELGFSTDKSCEDYVQQKIHERVTFHSTAQHQRHVQEIIPAYKDFLNHIIMVRSRPRSLKSQCRIVIRKAHPGRRLHSFFSDRKYPRALIDYIIRPYMLKPTVVE